MGLKDIKFETKDYVLLSVTLLGLILLYFTLKGSVNSVDTKFDKKLNDQDDKIKNIDTKRNTLSTQFTQHKDKMDRYINITGPIGNIIKFPSNSNICIGDSCMSYDGNRFIISKPVTILSNSHAGLDIRRTTKNPNDGDWNYMQFINYSGIRTSWYGTNYQGNIAYGEP